MFSAICLYSLICVANCRQVTETPQDWAALAVDSSTVIVGVAEKQMAVVHPGKMATRSTQLSDGKVLVELPNRSDYMEGRIVRMRIVEVLKRDSKVKAHVVINIFIPGAALTDLSPAFEEGQQYLVFLSKLAPDPQRFEGTTIHHDVPSVWEERFIPGSQYVIVGNARGLVHLTDENLKLIDQVKAALVTARL